MSFDSWCSVALPQYVIVLFPDHTHLLSLMIIIIKYNFKMKCTLRDRYYCNLTEIPFIGSWPLTPSCGLSVIKNQYLLFAKSLSTLYWL